MHMVPSCFEGSSSSSGLNSLSSSASSSFDFDLGLLPPTDATAGCFVATEEDLELPLPDCPAAGLANSPPPQPFTAAPSPAYSTCSSSQQVPSPAATLSPLDVHSPTMFSPAAAATTDQKKATSTSSSTHQHGSLRSVISPYSPPEATALATSRRLPSKDSARTTSSAAPSTFSLQEALAEFQNVKNKVKLEQESLSSPPPPYSSAAAAAAASLAAEATVQIKIEPVESPASSQSPSEVASVSYPESGPTNFSLDVLKPPPAYAAAAAAAATMQSKPPQPPAQDELSEEQAEAVTVKMEPVISLVMEQAKRDISSACSTLNISSSKCTIEVLRS